VGTQVPALGGTNYHVEEDSENFVIEACEYKRSFLNYHPYISVITNIDLDHLDYYKNLEDYISAFQSLVEQTKGFVIISEGDLHSAALDIPIEKKIIVGKGKVTYFPRVEENCCGEKKIYHTELFLEIPEFSLQGIIFIMMHVLRMQLHDSSDSRMKRSSRNLNRILDHGDEAKLSKQLNMVISSYRTIDIIRQRSDRRSRLSRKNILIALSMLSSNRISIHVLVNFSMNSQEHLVRRISS
jgi:UDP-N-acetylmuramoylalanine-D-glutamate ligase